MAIYIGSYEFEGPFKDKKKVSAKSGIYALLHHEGNNDEYMLIDLGQSESLETWRATLDFESLRAEYPGEITIAVHYIDLPTHERNAIVQDIEREFDLQVKSEMAVSI